MYIYIYVYIYICIYIYNFNKGLPENHRGNGISNRWMILPATKFHLLRGFPASQV